MTWEAGSIQPRVRVISDNDYCGDPDGLVQLAHHYLSPSVDLRCVIGSRVADYDPATSAASADASAESARVVAQLAGRLDVPIVSGDYGDPVAGAPPLRVFTQLDTRLLLEDLYAKLALHASEA